MNKNHAIKLFGFFGLVAFLLTGFSLSVNAGATLSKPPNYLSLNNGLEGHWTFDGKNMVPNVRDISGQGYHGNLSLGSTGNTSTTTGPGKIGQSLAFDGLSDYVDMGDVLDMWTNDITITAWVKSATTSTGYVVSKSRAASLNYRYGVNIRSTGVAGIFMKGSGGTDFSLAGNVDVTDDQWHHVAFVFDRSANASIYVDGVLDASGSISGWNGQNFNSNVPLRIASYTAGDNIGITSLYMGSLDDVRYYTRVLSAEEIRILAASSQVRNNKTSASPQTGLVGHWTFDGKDMVPNVRDMSGQGNHGSLVLGASGNVSTTTAPGKMGQALDFDGTNDYVLLSASADGTALDAGGASEWSMTAWVKLDGCGKETKVGGWWDDASNKREYLLTVNASCQPLAAFINAAGTTYTPTGSAISPDTWYFLAGTFKQNTTGGVKLYVNGVQANADNTANSAIRTSANTGVAIGTGFNSYPTTAQPFSGLIDDFRIYNRELSAQEIYTLFSAGEARISNVNTGKGPLSSGLVGHWTFDGKDMVPNVRDASGQGNHGNLVLGASGNVSTTTAPGKMGQALVFDGADDYMSIEQSASLNLISRSYSFWVKPNTLSGIQNITRDSGAVYSLLFSNNNLQYYWYDGSDKSKYRSVSIGSASEWKHIVVTQNVSGNNFDLLIYMNGVQIHSYSDTDGFNNKGYVNRIGGNAFFLNGILDDFRIYNRALSPTEVLQLYQLGSGK